MITRTHEMAAGGVRCWCLTALRYEQRLTLTGQATFVLVSHADPTVARVRRGEGHP